MWSATLLLLSVTHAWAFIGWDEITPFNAKDGDKISQPISGWDKDSDGIPGWVPKPRTGLDTASRAWVGWDPESRAWVGWDKESRSVPGWVPRPFFAWDKKSRAWTGWDKESRAWVGWDEESRSVPGWVPRPFAKTSEEKKPRTEMDVEFGGPQPIVIPTSEEKKTRSVPGWVPRPFSKTGSEIEARDRTPYIVGGDYVANAGHWPSMCSLQLGDWHYCGASLIADDWVVTAAHCLLDYSVEEFVVVCGVMDHRDHSKGSMEVHAIEYWTLHKDYEWNFDTGYPNDVAVIKLKWPVNPYNPYVKKVELAPNDGFNWRGSECWAVGWGKIAGNGYASDELKHANLDVISNDECWYYWGNSVNWNHICAKDMTFHDQGACNGDSGGPLYCKRDEQVYQVGVFSWMAGDCHPYWPAMYSSVPAYLDWIKQHSGI